MRRSLGFFTFSPQILSVTLTLFIGVPAHAGFLDKAGDFCNWLLTDSLVDSADYVIDKMDHGTDVLLGFRPGPFEQRRINKHNDKIAEIAAAVLAVASEKHSQVIEARKEHYRKAKSAFLKSLSEPQSELASIQLAILKSDNSDAQDIASFHSLIGESFKSLKSTQFRKLAELLLRRSDMFKTSTNVLDTIDLIRREVPERELESADTAVLQITMIRVLADFKTSDQVLRGFKLVFADWAGNLTPAEFSAVKTVAANEVETFASHDDRASADALVFTFAKKIGAEQPEP